MSSIRIHKPVCILYSLLFQIWKLYEIMKLELRPESKEYTVLMCVVYFGVFIAIEMIHCTQHNMYMLRYYIDVDV